MAGEVLRVEPIADFSRGLIQSRNPRLLKPGFLIDVDKMSARHAPALSVIEGRTALIADPNDMGVYLGQLRLSDTGQWQVLCGLGSTGSIRLFDGAAFNEVGTMTAGLPIRGVIFEGTGQLILCDGVGVRTWNGSVFAAIGGDCPVTLTNPEVWLGRLWGVETRTRIGFSVSGDPTDFSTTGIQHYVTIDNPEGSDITGLKNYKDRLMLFTTSMIRAILGNDPDNFTVVVCDAESGLLNHDCCAEIGGYLYGVGHKVIWEYYRGATARRISDRQIDVLMDEMDPTRRDEACAGVDKYLQFRAIIPKYGGTYDEAVWNPYYRSWWVNKSVRYARYLLLRGA